MCSAPRPEGEDLRAAEVVNRHDGHAMLQREAQEAAAAAQMHCLLCIVRFKHLRDAADMDAERVTLA